MYIIVSIYRFLAGLYFDIILFNFSTEIAFIIIAIIVIAHLYISGFIFKKSPINRYILTNNLPSVSELLII